MESALVRQQPRIGPAPPRRGRALRSPSWLVLAAIAAGVAALPPFAADHLFPGRTHPAPPARPAASGARPQGLPAAATADRAAPPAASAAASLPEMATARPADAAPMAAVVKAAAPAPTPPISPDKDAAPAAAAAAATAIPQPRGPLPLQTDLLPVGPRGAPATGRHG